MIELRTFPLRCGVAGSAGSRESGHLVIRIRGRVEIGNVAGSAILRSASESAVEMTLGTLRCAVFAGERKLGVSERGSLPLRGGVAHRAIGGIAGLPVVGIGGGVIHREVAGRALRGSARVLAVGVALRARRAGVLASEREACLGMIELRALPLRRGVACLAGGGE